MIVTMRIEQTPKEKMRMKYIPEKDCFIETEHTSLMYYRAFKGVYGWIEGCGVPPQKHLDIYAITQFAVSVGDRLDVRVIGCFLRADGDNKIIAIEQSRHIDDLQELCDEERRMVFGLYPMVGADEGWFGKDKAIELIRSFPYSQDNE